MKQFKYLITSGCSFSDAETKITWPVHLESSFNIDFAHTGLCSQGNGLIARKAIYAVHRALSQGYDPSEILVCIMWSGTERSEVFFKHNIITDDDKNNDGWAINPSSFVENANGGWIIMNPWWRQKTSKAFYAYLYDELGQLINTYEKILWVQNYLKNLNIPYMMTAYHPNTYLEDPDTKENSYKQNNNITWMTDQIDFSHWLPVTTMHDWVRSFWNDDHFDKCYFIDHIRNVNYLNVDFHPTRKMHIKFTKEVILPFLKNKFVNYNIPDFVEYPVPVNYIEPVEKTEIPTRVFEEK